MKQGSTDAVTFLSFWRVVAVVWHACGGDHGTTLTDELETFRDDILRLLEDPVQKGMVSSGQLRGLANNAAELSSTDQARRSELKTVVFAAIVRVHFDRGRLDLDLVSELLVLL